MNQIFYPFDSSTFSVPPYGKEYETLASVVYRLICAIDSGEKPATAAMALEEDLAQDIDIVSKDMTHSESLPPKGVETVACTDLARMFLDATVYRDQDLGTFKTFSTTAGFPDFPCQKVDGSSFLFTLYEEGNPNITIPLRPFLQICLYSKIEDEGKLTPIISDNSVLSVLCAYYCSFDSRFQAIYFPDIAAKYASLAPARRLDVSSFLEYSVKTGKIKSFLDLGSVLDALHEDDGESQWCDFLNSHPDTARNWEQCSFSSPIVEKIPVVFPRVDHNSLEEADEFLSNADVIAFPSFQPVRLNPELSLCLSILEGISPIYPSPRHVRDLVGSILSSIIENDNNENLKTVKTAFKNWSAADEKELMESYKGYHGKIVVKDMKTQDVLSDILKYDPDRTDSNPEYSLTIINAILKNNLNLRSIAYKEHIGEFPTKQNATIPARCHELSSFGGYSLDIVRLFLSMGCDIKSRCLGENDAPISSVLPLLFILEQNTAFRELYAEGAGLKSELAEFALGQCSHLKIEPMEEKTINLTDFASRIPDFSLQVGNFSELKDIKDGTLFSNWVMSLVLGHQFLYRESKDIVSAFIKAALTNDLFPDIEYKPYGSNVTVEQRIVDRIAFLAHRHMSKTGEFKELGITGIENEKNWSVLIAMIFASLYNAGKQFTTDALIPWGTAMARLYPEQDTSSKKKIFLEKRTSNTWKPVAAKMSPNLSQFCDDMTQKAQNEGLKVSVVERDDLINQMITILSRCSKSNPLVLGEAGTGKTAIVEALAQRIVLGDVPDALKNVRLFQVDPARLMERTGIQGALEEKVNGLIRDAKETHAILFIDEIHMITDLGGRESNLGNMLKPYLARGEISIIGATTWKEYNATLLADKALSRRFSPIKVNELSFEQTVKVLEARVESYESHHKTKYSDDVLLSIARISETYIAGKHSPDRELDLMDMSGAVAAARGETSVEKEHILESIRTITSNPSITLPGMPSSGNSVEDVLKTLSGVAGQANAKKVIAERIALSNAGLTPMNAPKNVFLFCGPSGVGKTFTAMEMRKSLRLSHEDVLVLSMNEFAQDHETARLIGSPPGYIGYKDGGALTNFALSHQGGIVILDEIEKSSPKVTNMLLGVFDTGFLDSASGERVDCRSLTFVCTSNIGSENKKKMPLGFTIETESGYDQDLETLRSEVAETLGTPFLGRIDETVLFTSLSDEDLMEICLMNKQKLEDEYKKRFRLDLSEIIDDESFAATAAERIKETDKTPTGARSVWKKMESELKAKIVERL